MEGPRLAGAAGMEVGSGAALANSARYQLEKEFRRLTNPAAEAEEIGRVEASRRLECAEQRPWLLEG